MARLHSGDPSIYSALAEQCRRLDALGVDYEIVPGVPAFAAAAAVLGRELTVPGVAQTVTLTRVATLSTAMPPGEDLQTLSAPGATLVLHLAAAQIDAIVPQLLAGGYRAETPCAVVAFASWPQETVLRCTLAELAEQMHEAAGITSTAVIVVGDVLAAEGFSDSYLYSSERVRREHGIDAGPAARRHVRGSCARRATAPRRRRDQLAGRTGAGSRAAGGRGPHRRVRGRRRDATVAGRSRRRRRRRRHPSLRRHDHRHTPRPCAAIWACRIWCWPAPPGIPATRSSWVPTRRRQKPLPPSDIRGSS